MTKDNGRFGSKNGGKSEPVTVWKDNLGRCWTEDPYKAYPEPAKRLFMDDLFKLDGYTVINVRRPKSAAEKHEDQMKRYKTQAIATVELRRREREGRKS